MSTTFAFVSPWFFQVKVAVVTKKLRPWLFGVRVCVIPPFLVRQNEKLCIDQQENAFNMASF
jgi:hypothetical protein